MAARLSRLAFGPRDGARLRGARVAVLLACVCAAGASRSASSGALTVDTAGVGGSVAPGEWADYTLVPTSDDDSIVFEVEVASDSPAAVGLYLYETAELATQSDSDRLTPGATAIDNDESSLISVGCPGACRRTFYVMLGSCYLLTGTSYTASVFSKLSSATVSFTIRARRVRGRITHNATVATGTACDGRYSHHFWEVATPPATGGVEWVVQKVSGELDTWYARHERCPGPAGASFATGGLFGHGRASGSGRLPTATTQFLPGRYYISVKAAPEMCGSYSITTRSLTQEQITATS